MGCDGGTIPRRDELVRTKKKPEQKDKDAEREFRWLHCALTQERLQEPIVTCGLGRLYSKQNVIEQLLEKEKMPESAKHIKNMKDIKLLNLTPNPAFTEEDKSEGLLDTRHAPYICKLIGLEMAGKFRFIALWTCGCVMSERALKEIKNNAGICPLCQTKFSIEDVIVLNGNDEDLELMAVKIEMRSAKRKSGKKDKKDKKEKEKDKVVVEPNPINKEDVVATTSNGAACTHTITTAGATAATSGTATATATTTATVTATAATATAKPAVGGKIKMFANPKRLGAKHKHDLEDPDLKRLKTDYTVAGDNKVSEVYKSLFTSHKSEKEQERAHWVTYNPFYN